MKPVYKIDRKRLKYPRECYYGGLFRLFGILSPSRCWMAVWGFYGESVQKAYADAEFERVKQRVNKRTATRSDWAALRRWERRHGGWRGLDEY